MNMPVLVDWLSLLLGPVIIGAAIIAFTASRTAAKAGETVPAKTKAANGVAAACAILLGLLWLVGSH